MRLLIAALLLCCSFSLQAQELPVFERIMNEVKNFKLDTSAVPEDALTKKIRELRALGGVFNSSEAVQFKLQEDKSKDEKPAGEMAMLEASFASGNGKRWMDNAITWIFRKHFTLKEVKALVRFYKSPAGKKLSTTFPVVMMESLAAAQAIHDSLVAQYNKKQ